MDPRRVFMELVALDKQLRILFRAHPLNAQEANFLRRRLLDAATRLADAHPAFAASKEIEQALWKPCFYRRIEDFRRRIRKYATAAQADHNVRDQFARVSSEFQLFLKDSSAFYAHLRNVFTSWLQHNCQGAMPDDSDAVTHCRQSLHRCYVFLGDLARYRELHSQKAKKNFASAEALYYRALAVLPENGNPHNQLAVLATYVEAETVAVYRYCRSLLACQPFTTAEENLALLFERSRQRPLAAPIMMTSSLLSAKEKSACLKSFLHRLTRLHGILFVLSSPRNSSASLTGRHSNEAVPLYPRDMEAVLLKDMGMLLRVNLVGDALLLKLVVTNIFCIIRASESRSHEAPVENALRLSIRIITSVLECIVTSLDSDTKDKAIKDAALSPLRLAGSVCVFCDYLELHLDMLELLEQLTVRGRTQLESDVATSEQETSADPCALEFLASLATLVNHAQIRKLLISGTADSSGNGVEARQHLLKERIELRGFAPLEQKGSTRPTWHDDWAWQTAAPGATSAPPETFLTNTEAAKMYAWKLYRFARYLCDDYEGNSLLFCEALGQLTTLPVVDNSKTRQDHGTLATRASLNLELLSAAKLKQQQPSLSAFGRADFRARTSVDEDDDFEEEVIVYQPQAAQKRMSDLSSGKQYGGITSRASSIESLSSVGAFSLRAPSPLAPAKGNDHTMCTPKNAFGAGNSVFGKSLAFSGFDTLNDGGNIKESSQSLLAATSDSAYNGSMAGTSLFSQATSLAFSGGSRPDTNFWRPSRIIGDKYDATHSYLSGGRGDETRSFASMADLAAVERESALYQQRASSLSAFLGTPTPHTQIETQDPLPPQMPTRPPPGFGAASMGPQQHEHYTTKSFTHP